MKLARNTEANWRVNPIKLLVEFYLNILHACRAPNKKILGIHMGEKFLLATKVIILTQQYLMITTTFSKF